MLVGPVPSMLKELFASEGALLYALFCKTVHHLSLSSNTPVTFGGGITIV